MNDIQKGVGLHAFLVRLTAEVVTVMGLADLTLPGVDQDGEAHIIHSLFSVPVGAYDPKQRLFGIHGEIPPKGLPAITKIPMSSFGALRAVNDVS